MPPRVPHPNYFEGVLQLRNPSQELKDFVIDTTKKDERAVFTKIKAVKNGFDYFITSQKYLQILGKKIKQYFSGEFKMTSTLHTQNKEGKRLYRMTVLFREYEFRKGDTVIVDGNECSVLMVKGNAVQCQDKKSGKKFRIRSEMIRK